MNINKITPALVDPALMDRANNDRGMQTSLEFERLNELAAKKPNEGDDSETLRKTFQDFVGQTFFSQMISSMRSTQQEPAYFHGGQAEKIFQGQLDQLLSEKIADASASEISDPMFKLFQLRRQ